MHRVFVYGTLKRGLENHRLLEKSVFAGRAHTIAAYAMLDGSFPVLRDVGDHRHAVSGELYDVDDSTLARLDDLEDIASGMYERIEIDVAVAHEPAQTCKAFIYIGCAAYWDYRPARFYAKLDAQGRIDWKPGAPD